MDKNDLLNIPGIGPKKKSLFLSLGIDCIHDLIYSYPRKFKNYTAFSKISEASASKAVLIKATVNNKRIVLSKKGRSFVSLSCSDATGTADIVFFNSRFLYDRINEGHAYCFYGKASIWNSRLKMSNPEIVKKKDLGRILPVYRTTPGLSQNDFRKAVYYALSNLPESEELLPEEILLKHGFPRSNKAFSQMHFPAGRKAYAQSRRRIIYEEFFLLQMTILSIKRNILQSGSRPRMLKYDHRTDNAVRCLPFELTKSQSEVLDSISSFMHKKSHPGILLQGDVGSGKTLVAFLAARQAFLSGYQVAIMAPTELLAEQHHRTFEALFENSGMKAMLLTGNSPDKQFIRDSLKDGSCDIVIGTHAIIQDNVSFKNLGLIATDERHRFGVIQQNSLSKKGASPQVIVMSATPIPRTITEIIFGDMKILRLLEKPNRGLAPIQTHLVSNDRERTLMYDHMKKEMSKGRQIYYVCPRIDKSDGSISSVEEIFSDFKCSVFPSCRISYLHGRMTPGEKNSVMMSFRSGDIDMIVSTTVIEVGIDIPNATIMAIDSFERFGLAQLHQLRGRVGRGNFESYCYLIAKNDDPSVIEKARILQNCDKGFEIAKEDMKIRGPGHVFSLKQHGFPEFRLADIFRHYDILISVQDDINSIYSHSGTGMHLSPHLEREIDVYLEHIKRNNI